MNPHCSSARSRSGRAALLFQQSLNCPPPTKQNNGSIIGRCSGGNSDHVRLIRYISHLAREDLAKFCSVKNTKVGGASRIPGKLGA